MIGNNTTSPIPALPTPALALYLFAYGLLAVISIAGNILVLAVFIKNKSLRIPANYLIANLAITDILNGIIKDGFIILGLSTNGKYQVGDLCNFDGFFEILLYMATSFTLTATAVVRYLVIVYSYGRKITSRVVLLIIIIIWIYCMINALLPIFGWSRYIYQPVEYVCLPDWSPKSNSSYLVFSLIVNTIAPFCVLGFCYISIYIYVKKSSKRLLGNSNKETTAKSSREFKYIKKEISLTKKLFFVYLAFAASYLPYNVVALILVPSGTFIPQTTFFIVGYLTNCNSALNPFLYGIVYRSIRSAYREFICSLWRKPQFTSNLVQVQSFTETPLNTDRYSDIQSNSISQNNKNIIT